jgi:two-component system response regulator WspF
LLRIAIVNGRARAVEILRQILLTVPEYEVAWVAADGAEAVRKCSEDHPDLLLMDLDMPHLDGVQATSRIMRENPCAILITTSAVSNNAGRVFEAMGQGALDVVATPRVGSSHRIEGGKELLDKISRVSRLITTRGSRETSAPPEGRGKRPAFLVIGSSAGGPKALATILGALPVDFPGAVVIVQHIDSEFAPRLVEWLAGQTLLPVRLVENPCPVEAGTVLVAGGSRHLLMGPDMRLTHIIEPRDAPYRPSIDVFFSSVADHWPEPALAVLLTGMGKDGAMGLLDLRRAGWHTIAQDESSSVVYGMPRAAADLGAAVEVLSLAEITRAIIECAGRVRSRGHYPTDKNSK